MSDDYLPVSIPPISEVAEKVAEHREWFNERYERPFRQAVAEYEKTINVEFSSAIHDFYQDNDWGDRCPCTQCRA